MVTFHFTNVFVSPRVGLRTYFGHFRHGLVPCSQASQAHRISVPQDCFYASVFEHENPSLKTLPLAVQQKQIVVTCNYEARRRVCLPHMLSVSIQRRSGSTYRPISRMFDAVLAG